jgi:hypothetical protein
METTERRGIRAFFCPGESKLARLLYNMEGDGLEDWLKQTGREVARAAGSELKSVAKDRAAQYARSLIGEGLKEALGDAAGAVGKAAVDEAGRQGKHQAKALISKYFGGDGIGRPCSYKIGDLRKAVTAARRANHITGAANKEQLMLIGEQHADIPGKGGDRIRKAYMEQGSARRTVSDLRDMRSEIKDLFHHPVSRMSKDALIRYVYMTAKHLGWKWTQLEGLAQSRRQPRGCRSSKLPGRLEAPEEYQSRDSTTYNTFVGNYIKQALADFESGERRPEGWKAPMLRPTVADYMKEAAAEWKKRAPRRTAARKGVQTRRAKKEESARRAQVRKEQLEERKAEASARARASKQAFEAKHGTARIPKKRTQPSRAAKGSGWEY